MQFLVLFFCLLVIAGCGTSTPQLPAQIYQAPRTAPIQPLAKVVSTSPEAVVGQLQAGLQNAGLTLKNVEVERGIVVATYEGDPERFVDCGTMRFGRGGQTVPAARQTLVINDLATVRGGRVYRDLRLDTRLLISAQRYGRDTSVSVDAKHVLTKTVGVGDQMVRTESIAFDNQGNGSFRKGTKCRSTGKLEQLALSGVPGRFVALATTPTQGFAATQPILAERSPVQQGEARPTAEPSAEASLFPAPTQPSPVQETAVLPPAAEPQSAEMSASSEPVVTTPSMSRRATKRVALVIGNSAYQKAEPLANPVNDAKAIAAALRRLGFVVIEAEDQDKAGMQSLLRRFANELYEADASLFFYAGHGLQVQRRNYLVPIDATLESEIDLPFDAVAVNVVLELMEQTTPQRLVFLDACRDNPLARRLARSTRAVGVGPGLARMNSRVGTLIAFATEPDQVALDGEGEHSPFTEGLLQHIESPGIEVRQMLSRVRATVLRNTGGEQLPLDTSALIEDFYFVQS